MENAGNRTENLIIQQPISYANPYQQPVMVVQTMPQQEKPCGSSECKGKYPEQFYCPTCKKNLVSHIETSWGIGSCVWCFCCAPTLVLAFLPCCVDGLRDVKHTCPLCQQSVGKNACLC